MRLPAAFRAGWLGLALLAALLVVSAAGEAESNLERCAEAGIVYAAHEKEWAAGKEIVSNWCCSVDPTTVFWKNVWIKTKTGDFHGMEVKDTGKPMHFDTLHDLNPGCQGTSTSTFHYNAKYTNSWSNSFTRTVSVENSVELSVGVPDIFGAKDTLTMKMEDSSTWEQSGSVEKEKGFDKTFPICPRTKLDAVISVNAAEVTVEYDFEYEFGGTVEWRWGTWEDWGVKLDQYEYNTLEYLIWRGIQQGSPACEGFRTQGDRVYYTGRGKISGQVGSDIKVNPTITQLPSDRNVCPGGVQPCASGAEPMTMPLI